MIGAILGDIIGSPYEFDMGGKTKDFPLFSRSSGFTDDSVMTVAVADALVKTLGKTDGEIRNALVKSMKLWGRKYPDAGYGYRFCKWLSGDKNDPYGSYGNGSAMRVSAAGWLYDSLQETRHYAGITAAVTHNHPEGIKGAEAVASAIYMSRKGMTKAAIKDYITQEFGYDLSRTCDEIRPGYHHVESCMETVPEAITAFIEGEDFEDVIRTAVSLGGDCDTLTCIAGSIAEAFYGIPKELEEKCLAMIPEDFRNVIAGFNLARKQAVEVRTDGLRGNSIIERAIESYCGSEEHKDMLELLSVIWGRMTDGGYLLVPVYDLNGDDEIVVVSNNVSIEESFFVRRDVHYKMQTMSNDGKVWLVAYTSIGESEKGDPSTLVSMPISSFLRAAVKMKEKAGVFFNPWGTSILIPMEIIEVIIAFDTNDNGKEV